MYRQCVINFYESHCEAQSLHIGIPIDISMRLFVVLLCPLFSCICCSSVSFVEVDCLLIRNAIDTGQFVAWTPCPCQLWMDTQFKVKVWRDRPRKMGRWHKRNQKVKQLAIAEEMQLKSDKKARKWFLTSLLPLINWQRAIMMMIQLITEYSNTAMSRKSENLFVNLYVQNEHETDWSFGSECRPSHGSPSLALFSFIGSPESGTRRNVL